MGDFKGALVVSFKRRRLLDYFGESK